MALLKKRERVGEPSRIARQPAADSVRLKIAPEIGDLPFFPKLHVPPPAQETPLHIFTGGDDSHDDATSESVAFVPEEFASNDSLYAAARQAAAIAGPARRQPSAEKPRHIYASRAGVTSVHPLSCDAHAKAAQIARQLDTLRQRRTARVLTRLFDRCDLSESLAPSYRQLKDDSTIFQTGCRNYLLQPSVNLMRIGGLGYSLPLPKAGLCGLWLAPLADVRPARGHVRIEIRLASGELLARATYSAAAIEPNSPARFEFPPLSTAAPTVQLGIFADDVDVPLGVLEWRNYSFFGLGRTISRAFCALDFASP